MQIDHGTNGVVTKSLTLGAEATKVWRNRHDPKRAELVADYRERARYIAQKLNVRVNLFACDGRILHTAVSRTEAGIK